MKLMRFALLNLLCFNVCAYANEKPVKVAFIGDSDYKGGFKEVLELIKNENAELVIHSGDLAYHEEDPDSPKLWDQRISEVLGEKFPYLFLIGNHDVPHWFQKNAMNYDSILRKRIADNPELVCSGEHGVKSYCIFRGIFFLLSGVGSYGENHEHFIDQALAQNAHFPFRICAWHKNQEDMQTGFKTNEVGWQAYQICQKHGAMIVTGHEHSYARTRNLDKIGSHAENHGFFGDPEHIELKAGNTFVILSGLGGNELYPFNCKHKQDTWWASLFSDKVQMRNGVLNYNTCRNFTEDGSEYIKFTFGALFVTFNVNGDPTLAKGEFKTINGDVVDAFTVRVLK